MARSAHRRKPSGTTAVGATSSVTTLPGVDRLGELCPDDGYSDPARGAVLFGRRRVLLLNATYEPLTAVSTRRAVVLVLRERAEVVHEDAGHAVHSAQLAMPLPTVIRLRTYVKVPYRAVIPLTRAALMHRDGFRCGYCSSKATTIDHIVPRSRGGAHTWENCVACCAACNHRKADRLLAELGWRLQVTPKAPRGRYWRLLSAVKEIDPDWAQYIDVGAA